MSNITQEDFEAYVDVQESGVTNMFNVSVVSDYSGLRRDQIMEIMTNYSELKEKYGNQKFNNGCRQEIRREP